MSASLGEVAIKAARARIKLEDDEATAERLAWLSMVEPLKEAINAIQDEAGRAGDQCAAMDYVNGRVLYGPKFGEMSEPRAAYVKFVNGVVRVADVPFYRLQGNPDECDQSGTYSVEDWLERLAYDLLQGGKS